MLRFHVSVVFKQGGDVQDGPGPGAGAPVGRRPATTTVRLATTTVRPATMNVRPATMTVRPATMTVTVLPQREVTRRLGRSRSRTTHSSSRLTTSLPAHLAASRQAPMKTGASGGALMAARMEVMKTAMRMAETTVKCRARGVDPL